MRSHRHTILALSALLAAVLVAGCEFGSKLPVFPTPDTSGSATPDVVAVEDVNTEDVVVIPAVPVTMPIEAQTANEREAPQMVHLTWQQADAATTATVQWRVDREALDDTWDYRTKVWFAREDEVTIDGDTVTMPYDEHHVVDVAAVPYDFSNWFIFFYMAEVELTGLQPSTKYYYRAGSWDDLDEESGALTGATVSKLHSFKTGREKGSTEPFTFAAGGDSRGGYLLIQGNAPRLHELDVDFWMFSGDMTTTGTLPEWATWFDAMGPLTTDNVMMPVQGNHETIGELYYALYALPHEEELPDDSKEHGWHFVYGNTLFIGLNSLTSYTAEQQKEWLEHVLRTYENDEDITWRIAMFHHPMYSSSSHGNTERLQEEWEPLFEEYGLDLTLAGHDHNYERTVPIKNNGEVSDGDGVVHVTAGGFFAPGYSPGTSWFTVISHHGDKNNYVLIDVDGNRLELTAYDGTGLEVLDNFVMTK